jgi:hypothetical protein
MFQSPLISSVVIIISAFLFFVLNRRHIDGEKIPILTGAYDASGQRHSPPNGQPQFDPPARIVRFVHSDLPVAEDIKRRGCSRNTTMRALTANRTIFSAWPAPQIR